VIGINFDIKLGGLHVERSVQRGIWVPTQHLLYNRGKLQKSLIIFFSFSGKLLLVLASTVVLGIGTHYRIYFSFQTFAYFEMGHPLRREKGSDSYWSLPFY
jgi:hypothetical protein